MARPRESSWPRRPLARVLRPQEASRSRIVIGRVPSPFVRSVVTRRAPNCSSANCPSSAWCVKSHRTSRPICVSRARPSWPCRRPARHIWSVFSKTRTCAPSTPSESPSCRKTSSWPDESVANVHKSSHDCIRNKRLFSEPTNFPQKKLLLIRSVFSRKVHIYKDACPICCFHMFSSCFYGHTPSFALYVTFFAVESEVIAKFALCYIYISVSS